MEIHPKIEELIKRFNGVLIDYRNKTIYLDRNMDMKELYHEIMDEFDRIENIDCSIPVVRNTPVEFAPVNGWVINKGANSYKDGDAFYTNEYQEFIDWKDDMDNGKFADVDEMLANMPKIMRK